MSDKYLGKIDIKKILGQVKIEIAEAIIAEQTRFIQGVTDKLKLEELKRKLLAMPVEIKCQKLIVANNRKALDEAASTRDQEEAILMSLIASEINGGGKPAYSNKEARDAELITRKKNSPAYREAESAYKVAEEALNTATFELEKRQDEFKSLRITARITCQELALLGLENEEDEADVY